ncbi:MAG: SIR2 family protein [Saprospiraceae bacterium]|nr:SIR2 family protein [Saprospiraceae bacterium]
MTTTPTLDLHPLSNDQLEILAEQIELRKCVLVLGPAVAAAVVDGRNVPVRQQVVQALNAELQQQAPHLMPPDPNDLAMTCTAYQKSLGGGRLMLDRKMGQLLRAHTEPSELLRQIAHLPFRVVLTVAQDNLLERAYAEEGSFYQEGTYRMGKTQTEEYDETSFHPFVYHLFGRALEKDVDSLVLTQDDQMKYIDSVQGVGRETRLPTALRNAMQDCPCFLFLGFNYDDWYLRVLLHILQFSQKAEIVFGLHHSDMGQLDATTEAFYKNQFKFSFATDDDLELVKNLHARLHGAETPSKPTTVTRKLLYLNAPADRDFVQALDKALVLVKRNHGVESLTLENITVGSDVNEAPHALVDGAHLIVPILSADFCDDDRLVNDLLPRALSRHIADAARVVAVYAREVSGAADLLEHKAAMLPGDDIPVSDMNRDKAFEKIARELEKVLEAL